MKVGEAHLTYCTNIHPGESWAEIEAAVRTWVPRVRRRVVPKGAADRPFGVGLRLSAMAARELAQPGRLDAFRDLLDREGLYVFTINGFPYGPFHGRPVKEGVYLPDWQDEARLEYTNLLADLLARLLPEGMEGSINTVPGSFKPWASAHDAPERIAGMMIRHVAHLAGLRERTGRTIALALEPEPACFLETVAETVEFFRHHLHSPGAAARLDSHTGLSLGQAQDALRRHIGVCLDLCHAAVEFEEPRKAIAELKGAGIAIAKLQLTAGLRLVSPGPDTEALLRPFADPVYLHQVVERGPAGLRRFTDLGEALSTLPAAGNTSDAQSREWRVRYHVPLFAGNLGAFGTTRDFVAEVLDLHRHAPISRHLEVETYTWDVLPERYRTGEVD
ncbi:MAG TPA: metabolite traffic protein EboE, partial [Arenibaculum sp.]|nr:metabolite traffic protein EboE [Arenibaculum sp.]